MILCRFNHIGDDVVRLGLVQDGTRVTDLTAAGVGSLQSVLESDDPTAFVQEVLGRASTEFSVDSVQLRAPIEGQEVWAAGVTYLRSKTARMEESDFSASAYDKVYEADRPEIFFKAVAEKVVATGEPVGIREDAKWSVPEAELALVLNSRGVVVGHTIGNDMSSRDIEGENLLYLPQAKVYKDSCALGPWIRLGTPEGPAREWMIRITIFRNGAPIFMGETSVGNIKRTFSELARYLFRSQRFPHGAVLLTGTGIVPPDSFTLMEHDAIEIEIPEIGVLRNSVIVV